MSDEAWLILGAWLSTGLTLAMYSFLYGDNPFFKAAEHFYVGVSAGYLLVVSWHDYIYSKLYLPLTDPVNPRYWVLLPAALGLLILTRFVPRYGWLSRWAFAALMGWTAGVAIPRTVSQLLLVQIGATIKPLLVVRDGGQLAFGWPQLSALIVLLGVVSVLVHFFFSVERNRPLRVASRVGVLFLMVSFGAAFGSTTMARMSLLYGRFYALQETSGSAYYYATPILLALMASGLAVWAARRGESAAG